MFAAHERCNVKAVQWVLFRTGLSEKHLSLRIMFVLSLIAQGLVDAREHGCDLWVVSPLLEFF